MSFGVLLRELGAAIISFSLSIIRTFSRRKYQKDNKMSSLEDLPIEILSHIFSFMQPKDIANTSKVSRKFYHATHFESIWIKRSLLDYGIKKSLRHNFSYKEVYSKVLHKYGKLLGLWQPQVSSYGGLLKVEFDDGRLVGKELHCVLDQNITQPLKPRLLFAIGIDAKGQLEIVCLGSRQSTHRAEIEFRRTNKFIFKCCDPEAHKQVTGRHQALLDWLSEQSNDASDMQLLQGSQELILFKFKVMAQYNYCYTYLPVELPPFIPNVPIQPGLFKGTYGAHGIELVMLTYEESGTQAKVFKISGDPNVPAGQVTFQVDLHYPLIMTVEQQTSIPDLEEVEIRKYDQPQHLGLKQSFRIPVDCLERFKQIPSHCTSRYFGYGQIAGQGFTNPSFSQGHWIVFSEELFGFLWLDLLSLSMYHRVLDL